jgi:tetratricopeptide (TPR) repeat protein
LRFRFPVLVSLIEPLQLPLDGDFGELLQIQIDRPYSRLSNSDFGWGAGLAYTYANRSVQGMDNLGDLFEESGRQFLVAGDPARALPLYREALDRGGGCSDELSVAENRLGALLAAQGRVADAVPLFEQALFRVPVYEAARLNLARALLATGQRARARQELTKALELEPDSPPLQQAVAELRRQLEP